MNLLKKAKMLNEKENMIYEKENMIYEKSGGDLGAGGDNTYINDCNSLNSNFKNNDELYKMTKVKKKHFDFFRGKDSMKKRNEYFDRDSDFRFAMDDGKGKCYSAAQSIDEFIAFRNSTIREKCFYEQTGKNGQIKMIFDLDLYLDTPDENIEKELIDNFINTLYGYIKLSSLIEPNILLLYTPRDKNNLRKISFHVIVSNLYFNSSQEHKIWAKKFQEKTNVNIDMAIYSNNQPFRIIGCHKQGQPDRILQPYGKKENNEKLYFMTYFQGNETLVKVDIPEKKKNTETKITTNLTIENEIGKLVFLIHDMVSKGKHSLCDTEYTNKLNYDNWKKVAFSVSCMTTFKPYENNDNDTELWETICDLYRHFNGNYENEYFKMKNYDYSQVWNLEYLHKIAKEHNDYTQYFKIDETIHLDNINPNETINLNNIGSYKNRLNLCDLLFVRSNMMTYKTQNLKELASDPNINILYVTFRCSLASAIESEFQSFGFENYSNCETKNGFFQNYPRLIVQIDSLHKVIGHYDLIILDEFVYTRQHLHSFVKEKNNCYNTLIQYIQQDSVKIIVMDALLDNDTINFFKPYNKKTHILENMWKSFENKTFEIFDDDSETSTSQIVQYIKSFLEVKKKVFAPFTSKTLGDKVYRCFKDNYKVGYANCDEYIPKEEWGQFDLFITTPTNSAGVSFNEIHFDKCIAYCTNAGASPEILAQMLFRVRNVTDSNITIFFKGSPKGGMLSSSKKRIDEYYSKRENIDIHLTLKLHNPTGTIIKDNYYWDFINFKAKENYSYWNYIPKLKGILIAHGIKQNNKVLGNDLPEADLILEEVITSETKLAKRNERNEVCNQPIISDEEFNNINKKIRKTKVDKQKVRKKMMVNTYEKIDFDESFMEKFEKHQEQFKNLNIVYNGDLENHVNRNMEYVNQKQDNIAFLHEKYKYLKPLIACKLINLIGFKSPFDIETIIKKENFPFHFLKKYLNENFKDIDFIFNLDQKKEKKKSDFEHLMDVESYTNEDLTFYNKILRQAFNIWIGYKTGREGYISYCIKGYDKWSEIKNFQEKKDIQTKNVSLLERPLKNYISKVDLQIGMPEM